MTSRIQLGKTAPGVCAAMSNRSEVPASADATTFTDNDKAHKMAEVTIEIRKNGPYRIHGEVNIVDHEGNRVPIPENRRKVTPDGKTWISLCRCGGSVVKPFCDGTHSRIGFIGAEEAVQKIEVTPPSP
jgi:CDGSH-type Zn-finger protein